MVEIDVAAAVRRASLGIRVIAHGWNHAFGGGRLPGSRR
ncbi:hypothetical protein SAMN04489712_1194 [Thermomonospora echinospora]|uniref:Uncharacterized protein n=1 Tax=Thermomonospora echinospora TaxID=1992 RepID=A0A1H6DLU2_9ACTN|nr:hypothetical protein SAMN04489712_1194 [Thermomonospora echinospora]